MDDSEEKRVGIQLLMRDDVGLLVERSDELCPVYNARVNAGTDDRREGVAGCG